MNRRIASLAICLVWILFHSMGRLSASESDDSPVVVIPHPLAGSFQLEHDPDKPLLAYYGGVGLRLQGKNNWVGYRASSPKDVEYLVRRLADHGVQQACVSFNEEPYESNLFKLKHSGAKNQDYSQLFIRLAHENNIKVYADLPIFRNTPRDSEYAKANPHRYTKSFSGSEDTHMLSPAFPEVRRYKRAVLMELVSKYAIDGLQLDFIRYPIYSSKRYAIGQHGYDEPTLNAFRNLYGYPSNYMPKTDDIRWSRLRAETVTQFIRELRQDLAASGIMLPIGVYNARNDGIRDSLGAVHQDWRVWEAEGLVDEHHPMILMAAGLSNLTHSVQTLMDVKRAETKVFGPLFLSEGFLPGKGDIPTPELVREAARRLIKIGCDSLWICRPDEVEEFGLWPVVREISEWSIREIRQQPFDPFYENLLKDAEFDSASEYWQIEPDNAVHNTSRSVESTGTKVTTIKLSSESPVKLAQRIHFRPIRHLKVESLAIACSLRSTSEQSQAGAKMVFTLTDENGEEKTLHKDMEIGKRNWKSNELFVDCKSIFGDRTVSQLDLRIEFTRGKETILLSGLSVERDTRLNARKHENVPRY